MLIHQIISSIHPSFSPIRPYLTEVLTVMLDHGNGSERIDIDELLPWLETMQSKFSADIKQNLKSITYGESKDLQ